MVVATLSLAFHLDLGLYDVHYLEVIEYLNFLADNNYYVIKMTELTNKLQYQCKEGVYFATYCITQMSAHDGHIVGAVGSID